ncbi:MAG: S-layer homology domain-containing protein [Bacillota bacterium]|nr:S-layer homology domain-containing protein [Bacillota bacterium]
MNALGKRIGSFILAAFFSAALLPAHAAAADNEAVLTKLNHRDALSSADLAGGTSAVLTVPYAYSKNENKVDLSDGLDISYDTTVYSSAVASFASGSMASVGGDPVGMTVTYQRAGDEAFYKTLYTIRVLRAAYTAPSFSGTVEINSKLPGSAAIGYGDFGKAYRANDGTALGSVVLRGSNPSFGALLLSGSEYQFGSQIPASSLSGGGLTFKPTGTGTVSYLVDAYDSQATPALVGSGTLTINVKGSDKASDIGMSLGHGQAGALRASDFSAACMNATGEALSYVTFKLPDSKTGGLYSNYASSSSKGTAVSASTKYYPSGEPGLSSVFFVPATGYAGATSVSYTGYTASNASFSGTVQISIESGSPDTIEYKTKEDTKVTFSVSDFSKACRDATSQDIGCVKFSLPSSSSGQLYYNFTSVSNYESKVSSSRKYYSKNDSDTQSLSKVTFMPESGYSGTVKISYTGYTSDNVSFSGTIKITVGEECDADDIEYETFKDTEVAFSDKDFKDACEDATRHDLIYVTLTTPSSTYGVLNYISSSAKDAKKTSVSGSTKYYVDKAPTIQGISFLPATDYIGTATIKYTGYNDDGKTFTGRIKVKVEGGSKEADTIHYRCEGKDGVTFSESDFNRECDDTTDRSLDYVRFMLPASTEGTLYYGYDRDTKISAGEKYYRNSSPRLEKVTFIPQSGYTGTVTISYIGCSSGGEVYTGKISISVKKAENLTPGGFTDVAGQFSWAADAIEYLSECDVITNTGDGLFKPGEYATRGEFVLMLCRSLKFAPGSPSDGFSDVPQSSFYFDAVNAAKSLGVAKGSGGRFYPANHISRQDVAVFIVRALSASGISVKDGSASDLDAYNDKGNVSDYAKTALSSLIKMEIIQGNGAILNPAGMVTRAEMAVMLERILTL